MTTTTTMTKIINLCSIKCDTITMIMMTTTTAMTIIINLCSIKCDTSLESQYQRDLKSDDDKIDIDDNDDEIDDNNNNNNDKNQKSL